MAEDIIGFLQAIHLMDLLIVVLIAALAVFGFVRGTASVAVILISTYLGFAIASIYYVPFATLMTKFVTISVFRVAEIFAFLILTVLMALLLAALLYSVLGNLQIPGRAGACLDRPAGMFTGFATGIIIAAIIIILFHVPFEKYEEIRVAGGQAPLFTFFHSWYVGSWLAPELQKLSSVMIQSIAPLTGQRIPHLISLSPSALLPIIFLLKLKLQPDEVAVQTTVK